MARITIAKKTALVAATVAAIHDLLDNEAEHSQKLAAMYSATAAAVLAGCTHADILEAWKLDTRVPYESVAYVGAFERAAVLTQDLVAYLTAEPKRDAHSVINSSQSKGLKLGQIDEVLKPLSVGLKAEKNPEKRAALVASAVATIDEAAAKAKEAKEAERKAKKEAEEAAKVAAELEGQGNEESDEAPERTADMLATEATALLIELAGLIEAGDLVSSAVIRGTSDAWKIVVAAVKEGRAAA